MCCIAASLAAAGGDARGVLLEALAALSCAEKAGVEEEKEEAHQPAACACVAGSAARSAGRLCSRAGCGATTRGDGGGGKLKRCGRCGRAAYCCKAHQADDWARHKAECKAPAQQHVS